MEHRIKTETFLVIGNFYWGKGDTIAKAKANFRREGGRLSDGYSIFTFDADTEFVGVTNMGYIQYHGNEPTVTKIERKRSA